MVRRGPRLIDARRVCPGRDGTGSGTGPDLSAGQRARHAQRYDVAGQRNRISPDGWIEARSGS